MGIFMNNLNIVVKMTFFLSKRKGIYLFDSYVIKMYSLEPMIFFRNKFEEELTDVYKTRQFSAAELFTLVNALIC